MKEVEAADDEALNKMKILNEKYQVDLILPPTRKNIGNVMLNFSLGSNHIWYIFKSSTDAILLSISFINYFIDILYHYLLKHFTKTLTTFHKNQNKLLIE